MSPTYGGRVSVVSRDRRRRWLVVLAGTAVILATPTLAGAAASGIARARSASATPVPGVLVTRALASAAVAHQGLAESRGSLGLPNVRRFGDVAALLGSTTRIRVWWRSADSWRVARLTTGGEQNLYAEGPGTLVSWDYERNLRRTTIGTSGVRLPRPDDLLPPQAARRLLGALDPADRITAMPARWIAGHEAAGVRIVPASSVSTIGEVDVWVDPASGLPLAVAVTDKPGTVAFESTFLDVDLTRPASEDVAAPMPEQARVQTGEAPDLVALIDRYERRGWPVSLAGQPRSHGLVHGTVTYGRGLARFVVVPLPPGPAEDVLDAARLRTTIAQVPGGRLGVLDAGLVSAAIVVGDDQRDFLVAGLVTPKLLQSAGRALLTLPRVADTGSVPDESSAYRWG